MSDRSRSNVCASPVSTDGAETRRNSASGSSHGAHSSLSWIGAADLEDDHPEEAPAIPASRATHQGRTCAAQQVPKFELRVLSGLNLGEKVAVSRVPIFVGGSRDCDLFLADPHIEQPCFIAEAKPGGVLVSVLKSVCCELATIEDGRTVPLRDEALLPPGARLRLNGIDMIVAEVTPETVRQFADGFQSGRRSRPSAMDQRHAAAGDGTRTEAGEKPDDAGGRTVAQWGLSRLKLASWLVGSLVVFVWMVSTARGIDISVPDAQAAGQAPPVLAEAPSSGQGYEPPASSALPSGAVPAQRFDELRRIFLGMVRARDLPVSVSLSQRDGQLLVEGTLPDEKRGVLERMIARFRLEQEVTVPIVNEVQTPDQALPFEIMQVTSGRYGNIVTDGGKRLFIGDALDGYQLIAIQENQVVFAGKARVSVAW